MRHLTIIFFVLLGLSACKTTQESVLQQTDIRDSVRIRDSIRIKDSISIKLSLKDSLRIKDSTVIIKDTNGNILYQEHWHERDHSAHQSDSTIFWKQIAERALHERDYAISHQKKEKEAVIQKPSLLGRIIDRCYFLLLGAILGGIAMWKLLSKYKKDNQLN